MMNTSCENMSSSYELSTYLYPKLFHIDINSTCASNWYFRQIWRFSNSYYTQSVNISVKSLPKKNVEENPSIMPITRYPHLHFYGWDEKGIKFFCINWWINLLNIFKSGVKWHYFKCRCVFQIKNKCICMDSSHHSESCAHTHKFFHF